MIQNKNLVIGLAAFAVLLVAVIGYQVWDSTRIPPVSISGAPATDPGTAPGAAPAAAPAAVPAADVAFDPKTATKVPAGQTPEQYLKGYHEAVVAKKFDVAYKMLPLAQQQSYGDATGYGEQVAAYGITSFELGKATVAGDETVIAATMQTPQMPIAYTWTFKKVGGTLYCAARKMGG
ncbi:MAG: hypothetical protein C0418_03635 [Coriobacteriaceae bacterium]|nr:hypothetical protein [Coriobacteriaceae bacterium]